MWYMLLYLMKDRLDKLFIIVLDFLGSIETPAIHVVSFDLKTSHYKLEKKIFACTTMCNVSSLRMLSSLTHHRWYCLDVSVERFCCGRICVCYCCCCFCISCNVVDVIVTGLCCWCWTFLYLCFWWWWVQRVYCSMLYNGLALSMIWETL